MKVNRELDIVQFANPHELCVTPTILKKILISGDCQARYFSNKFKAINENLQITHLVTNNASDLNIVNEDVKSFDLLLCIPAVHLITKQKYNVIVTDISQWDIILQDSKEALQQFVQTNLSFNKQYGITTVIMNFQVPQYHYDISLSEKRTYKRLITELNLYLADLLHGLKNVYVLDVDAIGCMLGKKHYLGDFVQDPVRLLPTWPNWGTPYTSYSPLYIRAVYQQLIHIHRVVNQSDSIKLVIFDLDNTLWPGVFVDGEYTDLKERLIEFRNNVNVHSLKPVHRSIIECIPQLKARGILVSIVSKNDAKPIRQYIARLTGGRISWNTFIFPKVNWSTKSSNIAQILRQTNLTAKSVLFVDDNPIERDEVLSNIPGIRVIGGDIFSVRRTLLWSSELQTASVNEDSLNRENSLKVVNTIKSIPKKNRKSYLKSLNITTTINKLTPSDSKFTRCFELLNKTNQFNTTGERRTNAEFFNLVENNLVYYFSVKDKFAEHGIVGVVLIEDGCIIQFIMSCRVIGLDVENTVIKYIKSKNKRNKLTARLKFTDVNTPCRDLYLKNKFKFIHKHNDFDYYEI